MSDAPSPPSSGPSSSGELPPQNERTMAMLAHLLGIFTGFVGPLVIWLVNKNESRFVDQQAREVLNFQLTLLIAYVASFLLMFVAIGCITLPIVWVCALIFHIQGCIAANRGQAYRYPLAIRFIS